MEYVDGPDLRELTCIKGAIRDEAQLAGLARQALRGLAYMHRLGYAHRDIKPENMVAGSDGVLRIIDYEFATRRRDARPCCTLQYAAPEIADAKMLRRKYDGKRADMYSLGMSLLSMALGGYPFQDMLDAVEVEDLTEEQRLRLMAGAVDYGDADLARLTPGFLLFVSDLVRVDPRKRPTAEEALTHWWLEIHDPQPQPSTLSGDAVRAAVQSAYSQARQLLLKDETPRSAVTFLSPITKRRVSAFVSRSQEESEASSSSPKTPAPPSARNAAAAAAAAAALAQETPTATLASDGHTVVIEPRRLALSGKRAHLASPDYGLPVRKKTAKSSPWGPTE